MPNDYTQNPQGPFGGRAGADLTRNPGGSKATPSQSAGGSPVNPASVPDGGKILQANATPSPSKDLGIGTIGDGRKPYRV